MDWIVNGANRTVSHSFGFGLMDALAMVDLAKKWQTIPSQRKCIVETKAIEAKNKNL
jgi:furin